LDTFPDGGYFFDPSDSTTDLVLIGHAFHLTLNNTTIIVSIEVDHFLMNVPHEELRGDHEVFDSFAYVSHAAIQDRAQQYVEYLGYRPVDIIQKTLKNTSQMAPLSYVFPCAVTSRPVSHGLTAIGSGKQWPLILILPTSTPFVVPHVLRSSMGRNLIV
jgi:hypothetical protein